jgi:hypothetical protein
MRNQTGGGRGPLLLWAAVAAVLAAAAYLTGAALARDWTTPLSAPTAPVSTLDPPPTSSPANWLSPDTPVDGTLGAESADEWLFLGQVGQSVTIEMWMHPGGGSNVDAELAVRLLAPDGSVLAEESGSLFLPPYLFQPSLPAGGLYRVQIVPLSGAPGRYSFALTLADASAAGLPTPQATGAASGSPIAIPDFQWPTPRREISGWIFHDPGNPGHIGLDIAAQTLDPIVAVADGEVIFAEWGGGYGNLVIVEHEGGWRSYYAHLTEFAVEEGQTVRQGELLGGAGTTGYSTGPHLHFELRYNGRPVDPHVYLP